MNDVKRVWLFREGNAELRGLLGGKGANLAEMTNIGLPVPPGFTITPEVCNAYHADGRALPASLMDDVRTALRATASEPKPTLTSCTRANFDDFKNSTTFAAEVFP